VVEILLALAEVKALYSSLNVRACFAGSDILLSQKNKGRGSNT
jgi:hypothetical protein